MRNDSRQHRRPLDPASPFVVDTRELGRRPGAMRRLTRTVPAPADLGIDVIGVPEGSDVELALRLESVQEGVLVTGTASATAVGECVRCLERVEAPVEVDLQELFAYLGGRRPAPEEDEEPLPELDGDYLDLEETLHDAVVLALPLQPVCREDCPGLCPQCGARLADDPEHSHDDADPRWAALQSVFDDEREN